MSLGDYLLEAGRRPWAWGEHDCATFPAGWAMLRGHADPMAGWRGTYATEEEAQEIIEEAGGLLVLWSSALAALAVAQGGAEAGDIGVCAVMDEGGLTANGGIFTGERWAFLAPRGLYCAPVDPPHVFKVWRP